MSLGVGIIRIAWRVILVYELILELVGRFAVLILTFKFPVHRTISIAKKIMIAVLVHVNDEESIWCVFHRRSLNVRLWGILLRKDHISDLWNTATYYPLLVGNNIGIEEDVVVVPLIWPCGISMDLGI